MAMPVMGPVDIGILAPLESLFIQENIQLLDFFGIEAANSYNIFAKTNPQGPLLFAGEQSDFCARQCLGKSRPYTMVVMHPVTRQLVMKAVRPFKCCLSELMVYDHAERLLGHVQQRCTPCARTFDIVDASGSKFLEIYGPCCSPWTFFIRMPSSDGREGQQVGVIRKKWAGFLQEAFTDADNFGAEFVLNMPVEHKAVVLACVFLIDSIYFERNKNQSY
eukprot:TRINITY_DN6685_c0_g1_i2.p2 TRINITY_DN6685_c0_g1~~TRINITY_DN6685_c0_g1_i2.p2  ORF type:complete len:255 (-),score=33.34 TRINITY_DN6685_c0_g1_i2:1241-1900(-)